jgi:hypothetical protein
MASLAHNWTLLASKFAIIIIPLLLLCGYSASRYKYVLKELPPGEFPGRHLTAAGQGLTTILVSTFKLESEDLLILCRVVWGLYTN